MADFKLQEFSWIQSAALLTAVVLCLSLISLRAASAPLGNDENLLAVPARNLAHDGFMGTTISFGPDSPWKGIERHTYNTLPVGILYLSAWFAIFPDTLYVQRAAFVLWGPLLLCGLFILLRCLTGDRNLALLATVLLGLDYDFIMGTASARVDVMCAALGVLGLALYCQIRLRNLRRAVLAASTLVMLSCFTHPQGILYLLMLLILAIRLDRRSLTLRHFAIAAVPFAVAGAMWGLYIAQDPAGALSQLSRNLDGQGRFPRSLNPVWALRREVSQRYLSALNSSSSALAAKAVILTLDLIALMAALFLPVLKKQTGIRTLVILTLSVVGFMVLLENSKTHYYMVHVRPLYCALIGALAIYFWKQGTASRVATALATTLYLLINLGAIASRVF